MQQPPLFCVFNGIQFSRTPHPLDRQAGRVKAVDALFVLGATSLIPR
jgi:hypothetical protein